MDKKDMHRLIMFGNVRSKLTKKKLSQITVEECLNDMRFWDRDIWMYAPFKIKSKGIWKK